MEKVYVVTNPSLGWDSLVGVFYNEKYVYSKYTNQRYHISVVEIDATTIKDITSEDMVKYGRTDYQYNVTKAKNIVMTSGFESTVMKADGSKFKTFNLIDPTEGDFFIEFDGEEQIHSIENLSVVADLFCKFTKIDKDSIRIFSEEGGPMYLGCVEYYDDSVELWQSFREKNVSVYY